MKEKFSLFETSEDHFQIIKNGVTMEVQRLNLPEYVAFKVTFSSKRKPIVVARTESDIKKFWTSIPEGRQKEAEGVGALIEEYFKSKM